MILPFALILVLSSLWVALGQMRGAFLRRNAGVRLRLADLLSVFVFLGLAFKVMALASVDLRSWDAVFVLMFAAFSWVIGIWLLTSAAVGNPKKRLAFMLSLPSSFLMAGSWMIYAQWSMDALTGREVLTWRTAGCLGLTVLSLLTLRMVNDWIATVDTWTETSPIVRLRGRR